MLNLDTLKEFLGLDPNKQLIFVLCLMFGGSIYVLHQDNQAKAEIIATKNKDCQEQLKQSRDNYEKQLNSFVLSSNLERDSIYRSFYKKIRSIDSRLSNNMDKINGIKNETHN